MNRTIAENQRIRIDREYIDLDIKFYSVVLKAHTEGATEYREESIILSRTELEALRDILETITEED